MLLKKGVINKCGELYGELYGGPCRIRPCRIRLPGCIGCQGAVRGLRLLLTQGVINMCGGAKAAVPVPAPRPTHRPKLQGLYARVCLGARPRGFAVGKRCA